MSATKTAVITCERCGTTTTDPDRWDPEADTGRIFCDDCWDVRDTPLEPIQADYPCSYCGRLTPHRLRGSTGHVPKMECTVCFTPAGWSNPAREVNG